VTWLQILAACSFAWGFGALLVIVALDGRNRIAHLLNLLHGGPRA
jgi:hypothetical protein